jgi:hypothetical protein
VDEHIPTGLHRFPAGCRKVGSPANGGLVPLSEGGGGCQENQKTTDWQATSHHGQNPFNKRGKLGKSRPRPEKRDSKGISETLASAVA